ncbi:probable G-protein coupled receptor 101 [Dendronephthya gigantea]|uniref:probable G-protein coupled receptor 101 n=1 Tax=Dendronephthya gigantea TaxID=151771 RepID=UPI00106CB3C5|nr:probable G-protein coupled receptor 101 [Dendronephthya gigantea]
MSNNSTTDGTVESCFKTYIVLEPTTAYIINSIIGCIVNIVFAVAGTFLNALVVCVFWKTPKLRLKVTYFMIMVLSTIDLSVSIIVHPLHVLNSIAEITQAAKCGYKMFYQTSAVIFSGMSFLTFFVMNCERYVSIVHPFFHLNHISKQRCLFVSSLTWIICLVTGIAPIFALDIQNFITVLAIVVIIGTFYIYVNIFIEARKRQNSRGRSICKIHADNHMSETNHAAADSLVWAPAVGFPHIVVMIVIECSSIKEWEYMDIVYIFPSVAGDLSRKLIRKRLWRFAPQC